MMNLNNTTNYTYIVIVNVRIVNDDYQVCKLNVGDNISDIEKMKNKFQDDRYHPTEEFANLLYKKYPYYDTEDIDSAFVSFTFVDNIPTINFQ